MENQVRQTQVDSSELEEKLNHLEYVVKTTSKTVASFKHAKLNDQTEDFLSLLGIVRDAISTYRDEVVDQIDGA